ncbi:hypothetical protein XH94_30460 [Bradyrhizobium zhanjiangense]|uniref:Uncharacterized protein n=1 Tax=Bradyrhizobium zhanjiangense TaxID=1325107 RepID=A0A4Q0S8F1_9BRAD|nr:hypothetical protein XH94_30460 [Bradyrhizobium zhanjiangense]
MAIAVQEQNMAKHLYRLRMGSYVGNLFRRSKHDLQQRLWLQCNLMRLGCELPRSQLQTGLAQGKLLLPLKPLTKSTSTSKKAT